MIGLRWGLSLKGGAGNCGNLLGAGWLSNCGLMCGLKYVTLYDCKNEVMGCLNYHL